MNKLTSEIFQRTFKIPMTKLGEDARPPCDFRAYFKQIPPEHFEGFDCSAGIVSLVYANADNSFQHVMISSENENVFMVIVLDILNTKVFGHFLLNLNK